MTGDGGNNMMMDALKIAVLNDEISSLSAALELAQAKAGEVRAARAALSSPYPASGDEREIEKTKAVAALGPQFPRLLSKIACEYLGAIPAVSMGVVGFSLNGQFTSETDFLENLLKNIAYPDPAARVIEMPRKPNDT